MATDSHAVLNLVAPHVEERLGFRARACRPEVLKQTAKRMVVRYDLEGGGRTARVIGKWYSTDRGELVASTLQTLCEQGFTGDHHTVPCPVVYLAQERVLFMEAVDGIPLRKFLETEPAATRRAGEWLAAFHNSDVRSPRQCGPEKQLRSVERWSRAHPALREIASTMVDALSSMPDPERPVHYDYHHSQILLDGERTVVLDLDESGMGDPDFDRAHFEAHLRMLALYRHGTPDAFDSAVLHFREGYAAGGGAAIQAEPHGTLLAFAWFKFAYQTLIRGAPATLSEHAVHSIGESLSKA